MEITQPDDFHVHVRDGEMMKLVTPFTASIFGKAIIMPNTTPPIRNVSDATSYKERILSTLSDDLKKTFQPLMTLYLTSQTSVEDIIAAKQSGIVFGVKLYPAGATTNSDSGVKNIDDVEQTLAKMEEVGMPLLIHGEVTDTDIFDRESVFLERTLKPLLLKHPNLRVVVEHVTTKEMAEFVLNSNHKYLGATITPHHLLYTRTNLFKPPHRDGTALNPHLFCLPVLKGDEHREALIKVAISGNKRFFAGTDSAPHPRSSKESSCCSAGVFASPVALEAYAIVFEQNNALDKLEQFMSHNGADFYGIPRNSKKVKLTRESWKVPNNYSFTSTSSTGEKENVEVVPLMADSTINWKASLVQ